MRKRNRTPITSETVMLDREQATQMFSIGYTTLDRIARECNAKITIGSRRVVYSRARLEEYFNSLMAENEASL